MTPYETISQLQAEVLTLRRELVKQALDYGKIVHDLEVQLEAEKRNHETSKKSFEWHRGALENRLAEETKLADKYRLMKSRILTPRKSARESIVDVPNAVMSGDW